MEEIWQRFVGDFLARLDGPLHFRFIVQPLMAVIFAVIDGWRDATLGKPAYFWAVVSSPQHRRELLRDGWKHFGKIFILAIVLDLVYQLRVHGVVYPVETLFVALVLAVIPYAMARGLANRILRMFRKRKPSTIGEWIVCLALFCGAGMARGQEPKHPLKPADRSSPRAALQKFLEAGDALGVFLAREYTPSPSRMKFQILNSQAKTTLESLDLSELPPASRTKKDERRPWLCMKS